MNILYPLRTRTTLTWLSFPPSNPVWCTVDLVTPGGSRHRVAQDFALESLLRALEVGAGQKIEFVGNSEPGLRAWSQKQDTTTCRD